MRVVRIEAAYFLDYLLPANTAEALHIYFPDPWPKRKHRKNRLINQRFTQLARTALRPGGKIYLRTDDADYFAQNEIRIRRVSFFQGNPHASRTRWFPATDFERAFAARRPNPAPVLAINRHAAADVRGGLAANCPRNIRLVTSAATDTPTIIREPLPTLIDLD